MGLLDRWYPLPLLHKCFSNDPAQFTGYENQRICPLELAFRDFYTSSPLEMPSQPCSRTSPMQSYTPDPTKEVWLDWKKRSALGLPKWRCYIMYLWITPLGTAKTCVLNAWHTWPLQTTGRVIEIPSYATKTGHFIFTKSYRTKPINGTIRMCILFVPGTIMSPVNGSRDATTTFRKDWFFRNQLPPLSPYSYRLRKSDVIHRFFKHIWWDPVLSPSVLSH